MKDLAYGRDGYTTAAQRRVSTDSVNLKDKVNSVKRKKNLLKNKASSSFDKLRYRNEMQYRDKLKKGAINTEKNSKTKVITKKPVSPPRVWLKEGDKDYANYTINKYQGTGGFGKHKAKRYF